MRWKGTTNNNCIQYYRVAHRPFVYYCNVSIYFYAFFSSGEKLLFIFYISYQIFTTFLFYFIIVCRAEILDGDKSLVIKNVLPSDEGTYICEAHNSVGQISSKAQLIVNCKYLLFLLCVDYIRGQSIRVLKI